MILPRGSGRLVRNRRSPTCDVLWIETTALLNLDGSEKGGEFFSIDRSYGNLDDQGE
jgi:hypothetical protein